MKLRDFDIKSLNLIITRTHFDDEYTAGKFKIDGVTYHTLERPWLNNALGVSCIPNGIYRVTKREPSEKFPYTHFILPSVIGRTAILIHAGNYPHDSSGCLLVGKGKPSAGTVSNSRKAIEELVELLPDEFLITIQSFDAKIKRER